MKRLLASNLLPQRAGQPVKALVHVSFADLCDLDVDSKLQEAWIAYRARWAAHRAAASVSTGNGGAWLEGDAAYRSGLHGRPNTRCLLMAEPVPCWIP